MKLHIPLKLLAALMACVMHTSFATGVVTIPDNATDAEIIAAKQELSTPTLTWLYNQNPASFPKSSSYQLVEVMEDGVASDFSITKYLKDEDSKDLTPVTYNVEFGEVFGDPVGFDSYYYKWSTDENGNRTLISTTVASDADITYFNHYQTDNVSLSRIDVDSTTNYGDIDFSLRGCSSTAIDNEGVVGNIVGDFIVNHGTGGGAIYNGGSATIGDITGDFISNDCSSSSSYSSYGGAIYSDGIIGNIVGDFIGNYSYSYSYSSYGGAISNSAKIEDITGDFIGNYADAYSSFKFSYGGAIYNSGIATIGDITGDFIGNYAAASSYSYGGAISNSATIGDIAGDFIGNYASSSYSSYGGAISNSSTIEDIAGDFIGNYSTGLESAYGGAIYSSAQIGVIKGDFIGNEAESTSALAYGGAIYISSEGSLSVANGNFIGNTLTSNTQTYGGAIYNAGSLTLLAQDDSILFNDNVAKVGEALYNSGTSYLYAYDGQDITFNDTIYNIGATANIIIGELDSTDYTGSVVLNAILSGGSTATVTLASGTLEFGSYTDSDSQTSYGNITGTKLTITGGAISTVDNEINETSLGYLTLTAEKTCWSLDLDLTNKTADTLTASSVSGTGILLLDGINLIGSTTEGSITVTLTTNSWLKSSISTDVTGMNFLIDGASSSSYSGVSYDATTGQLTISTANYVTLDDMVDSSNDIKQYQLTKDELVSDNLGVLAGTSLSVFGQGYNVTADGDGIAGITINNASQILTISDVAQWSGFSGDAVTNNAGTLTIKASSYNSTWSNSITNKADMTVLAAADKTVTFDAAVAGTGTLNLNDADNSGSIVFNSTLTQGTVNINAGSISFNGEVSSDLLLSGGSLSIGASVNSKTLTMEGGSLSINDGASLTVTGALSASGKTIANAASLSFGEGSVIGSITGAGTNTVTGDATIGSLDAASRLVITGEDTELTLQSNTSLASLRNLGLVDAGDHTFSLLDVTTDEGGSLSAGKLVLSGGTFADLTTDYLSLSTLSTKSYGLTVDSISARTSSLVELEFSSLSASSEDGTYLLISSTDDNLSWDLFQLSDLTAASINELIINEGKAISYLVEDGKLSLSIADASADDSTDGPSDDSTDDSMDGLTDDTVEPMTYIWDTSKALAYNSDGSASIEVFVDGKLTSYDTLDNVTQVNVSTSVELDLTNITPESGQSLLISNMCGFADATLSIVGDGVDEDSVTLFNDTKTVAQNAVSVEKCTLIVDNTGSSTALSFGALELDSANLTVLDGASLTVDSVESSAISVIKGAVTIVGDESSKLLGSYVDATLNFQTSASATVYVSDAEGLSLTGTSADIQLISASGNTIKSFNMTNSTLALGSIAEGKSFTIAEASSMSGGTLSLSVADSIIGSGSTQAVIAGAGVSLSGTKLEISSTGSALDINSFTSSKGIALFTLTEDSPSTIASDSTGDSDVTVELVSGTISKYFTNATYVNGVLYADLNTNSYGNLAQSGNGTAGLGMMSEALVELNPQLEANRDKYPDLALALDGLDAFKAAGDKASADKLGAAIAGASLTSLGSAAQADLSRQLRTIRSRSKNAGLANATILESNGGAWISAEGGYSSLSTDGTASGHDLTSTGASIGAEGNVGETWRFGAAFTLVKGDLSSDAPDRGDGDMTSYYGSFYANSNSGRWAHNIVATIGKLDASLERTVTTNTSGDYYKTKGDTDGMSFALSYELGYTYDLNEEATSTIQPLVALSYINSSISGYTEKGSDAALTVGDQKNNYVTLGVGVQYDTIVGGAIYNRESLLTTRMLLNIDAGDRMVEADVKLAAMNGSTYTIKGSEPGAIGLEFGLGLDVPVSESSSLFVDVSCEFRSKMTDVSGGIGYRFSF